MMDRQGSTSQTHPLEIHTDQILIQGTVTLPFRRVTEIMNSADRDFLSIDRAMIAPLVDLSQVSRPNAPTTVVRRMQVRYVATYTDLTRARPAGVEFVGVQKVPTACYGFLGPFVFHAYLHMRPGTSLLEVLETGAEDFIPFTRATVYLVARPDAAPRQHEVIIINRRFLDAAYLA
ncbi:MAG TPA: hypothetical protein VM536_02020 [Chloroflexia bacterium]|nr:hypothetical protein [Chloroflexia bacterium]